MQSLQINIDLKEDERLRERVNKVQVCYHYSNSNPLINMLLSLSRTRLLNMANFPVTAKSLLVDLGCSSGTLTRVLSRKAPTVGIDVDKKSLVWLTKQSKRIDLICADLSHLPFRNGSVNIAVCASVLEHVKNLEEVAQQISSVLKDDGIFVAGYPIETKMLKAVIELLDRKTVSVWDPLRVVKNEDYRMCPDTHKQKFPAIRDTLGRNFSMLKKEKVPLKYLPDFLSIYECAMMCKKIEHRSSYSAHNSSYQC